MAVEVWERLAAHTKLQMFWPHPGAAREGAVAETVMPVAAADSSLSIEDSHFALVIVVPEHVDQLHLSGRQKRLLHSRAQVGGAELLLEQGVGADAALAGLRAAVWTQKEVNP